MAVVVVSYNTKSVTLQCLDALCQSVPAGTEVCVVDNGSADGSAAAIEEFAKTACNPVRVIAAGCNLGFGRANNLAAASSTGEFIALLNSDAFVRKGVLQGLMDYLLRTPQAAIVGPRLENVDGSFQESRFPFPSPSRAWVENLGLNWLGRFLRAKKPHRAGAIHWLSGACLVVRREVWEKAGGFDESFFLYAEETDLQRRVAAMGWEIHWEPDFVVTHIGGGSGFAARDAVREHFFAGADRYIYRYHGRFGVWMFRVATCLGAFLRWVGCALREGQQGNATRRWAWILQRQMSSPLPGNEEGSGGHTPAKCSPESKVPGG